MYNTSHVLAKTIKKYFFLFLELYKIQSALVLCRIYIIKLSNQNTIWELYGLKARSYFLQCWYGRVLVGPNINVKSTHRMGNFLQCDLNSCFLRLLIQPPKKFSPAGHCNRTHDSSSLGTTQEWHTFNSRHTQWVECTVYTLLSWTECEWSVNSVILSVNWMYTQLFSSAE